MQTETNEITKAIESDLPAALQLTLQSWRAGNDLRVTLKKTTFYKYRKQLLDSMGVDIASPPVLGKSSTQTAKLNPDGWDPEPLEEFPYDVAAAKRPYEEKLC